MSIKVLHIIKSLGRGGAETLLAETLSLHDKQQFEFHYVYFLPWKDQMVSALQQAGGTVTCFSARNNIFLILKYRSTIRYVKKNKIDIIHCHLPWAGFLGRMIYRITGIPVIYTEHNKQERYHWVTRLLNRITFNWQSTAIAVSSDVALSIKENINTRIPVIEILNGVNTNSFVRDEKKGMEIRNKLSIPSDSVVVGTVAVFRFQKRLKEWLEVFSSAVSVNDKLYGIIVGDGPLKQEIVAHRKALGLEHRVFMPGLQTEVKPWLSAMDIYMMTSVFEGLPIALLEAMSMECAIVTTNAGGVREVIQHEKTGLSVEVIVWKKLGDELTRVVDDPTLLSRLAVAARTRVVENFGMERMVIQLEDLYTSLSK